MTQTTEDIDNQREMTLADIKNSPYQLLDFLEEDPAKRIAQVQKCRMAMLQSGYMIDKEETKILKDISSTDLGLLRMDLESEGNESLRAVAGIIGAALSKATMHVRPPADIDDLSALDAPVVSFEYEEDIPTEFLSTDFPAIQYDDVTAVHEPAE